jgi:hypothetical protein
MSWNEFVSIPDGETIYNYWASQCVALANQYAQGVLGIDLTTIRIEKALDWWENGQVAAQWGFERITSNPQPGDIFIGSYGYYD